MKLHYSFIDLALPSDVIEQALTQIGEKIGKQFRQLYIPYIDEFITTHSAVLDRLYGLHTTSTMSGGKNVIHRDIRLSAINFALADCGPGADTVFYNPVSATPKFIDIISDEMNHQWASYLIAPAVEIDRATLNMGECMLLDTQTPHAVRNSDRLNRLVLSINCKVSYREAYEYFANLGLIEVNILDSDRPLL